MQRIWQHLVNNRVGQDPNVMNDHEGFGDEDNLSLQHSSTEETSCRCVLTSASVAAVIDLPLEMPYRPPKLSHSTGIQHSASISDFLRIKNKKYGNGQTKRSNTLVDSRRKLKRSLFHAWDNPLALKLLGTRKRIQEEQERQEHITQWVIHPCSKIRLLWDVIMFMILAINVLLLPVAIAFFDDSLNIGWIAFSMFSDICFFVDVIFNFRTGIITNENVIILEQAKICRIYLKSWFLLDIISLLPLDYIGMIIFYSYSNRDSLIMATRALRATKLVRLVTLLKLLRAIRFLRYLSKWEQFIITTKSLIRVFNLVLVMLMIAHWSGCIQFLVPLIQDFPHNSWVSINRLKDETMFVQYTWSIFKALSHMVCIGYGRFPPQNAAEVWITIISMLIGATFYAMLIGHISTLMYSVDSASRQYDERIKQVEEYMRYRRLPPHIKSQVYEYYGHKYHGQLFDEESILNELSHSLQEIVPFFQDMNEAFINCVITRLKFEVFLPGDYIIRQGMFGTKMYFIQQGKVNVLLPCGKVATSLSDGAYFGETCLLMKSRRIGSVKAASMCDLYALSKDDFQHVLDEFPNMRIKLEDVACERLAAIASSRDLEMDTMSEEVGDGTVAALPRTDSHPMNISSPPAMTSSLSDQSHSSMTNHNYSLVNPSMRMTASNQSLIFHESSNISTAPTVKSRTNLF